MKISETFASKDPSISFEVFPPKRTAGNADEERAAMERTRKTVREIAAGGPAFISVTCGAAGGSTGSNTREIAEFVERDCHTTALAHLTCVNSSRARIADEVSALRQSGIENVLCLRGDPPIGETRVVSDFPHAVDLVRELKKYGFCLGGACYPEGHPECAHLADDISHLKAKVEAGLDFLVTQMFFDNNILYSYLAKIRSAGIGVPVIAGVMPVTNGAQISRICALSGTHLPPRFKAIVDRFGEDPAAMLDAGVAYATDQIIDLVANGVDRVHVYTMNKSEVALRILGNLRSVLKCKRA